MTCTFNTMDSEHMNAHLTSDDDYSSSLSNVVKILKFFAFLIL